jgi:hypothetical protein
VIQSIWWHRQHCQAKSKYGYWIDTISMLDLHTEVLPHGMNHWAQGLHWQSQLMVIPIPQYKDFATISSLKE